MKSQSRVQVQVDAKANFTRNAIARNVQGPRDKICIKPESSKLTKGKAAIKTATATLNAIPIATFLAMPHCGLIG